MPDMSPESSTSNQPMSKQPSAKPVNAPQTSLSQTGSSKTVASTTTTAATERQPRKSNPVLSFIGSVFTLIFRLGLLTGGAALALVVGGAIATVRPADPAEVTEPPVLEKVLNTIDRIRS